MLQGMPIEGNYEPSPQKWVRDQVEEYERSGGQRANTLRDTGWPVVIVTTRGHRVRGMSANSGSYESSMTASTRSSRPRAAPPEHPLLVLQPERLTRDQLSADGYQSFDFDVREVSGEAGRLVGASRGCVTACHASTRPKPTRLTCGFCCYAGNPALIEAVTQPSRGPLQAQVLRGRQVRPVAVKHALVAFGPHLPTRKLGGALERYGPTRARA